MLGEAKELVKEPAVLNGVLGRAVVQKLHRVGGGSGCGHSK